MVESLFKLRAAGVSARGKVLAGLTTFLTMASILLVNPDILAQAGMDHGAVFVATCLAAAIGSAVMGLLANYPIAQAPGMGINAFFTFGLVKGLGLPWQTALGAVFVSGVLFMLVSVTRLREGFVNGIPLSLKQAISAGVGLFIALIALQQAGVVVANPDTLVGLGDLHKPQALLALAGFALIVTLERWRVPGAILLGILAITALSAALGLINIEQNAVRKIFSVASSVFLPPTLVASLYGMNFRFMPELEWQYGYAWALGLMIASALLPMWYFRKRGWLK